MTRTERAVNAILRTLYRLIFRIEARDLQKLPLQGPALLMTNHTSNLEGPAYYVFIQPRRATALGKIELWHNPLTRFLMQLWGVIPVRRGQVDRGAIKRTMQSLDDKYIVGIAPEGTRSRDERLRRAHPGIAMLATRKPVPVYPVVHWGFTDFRRCLVRFRRATVTFRVGEPFVVRPKGEKRPSAADLKEMADEMMFQLARLLPERMRGYYADMSRMRTSFIQKIND